MSRLDPSGADQSDAKHPDSSSEGRGFEPSSELITYPLPADLDFIVVLQAGVLVGRASGALRSQASAGRLWSCWKARRPGSAGGGGWRDSRTR